MDKALWGIHMPISLGSEPTEQGFIAIGWDAIGDLSLLPADRESYKRGVQQSHPDIVDGAIPGAAGVLYRFRVEMRLGDVVVYPSKPDRMVNIGRIIGEYEYCPGNGRQYIHRRRVQWLKSFPRTTFSQSALNEIGSAITMFRISSNAEEFVAALDGRQMEAASIDEVSAEQVSAQVEESTEDFILKRLKSSQTPYQFEQFVAHLLKCMGYHARVTAQSGDGGIDIIAHRDELGFEPPIIKVQCKQTLHTIGRPDVQQLHGAIEPGEHGLFVTLGGFTPDARTFERTKPNLRLIDGTTLIDLIFGHYEAFEPRYQTLVPLKRAYLPGSVARSD